jgi:hypothetical protein
MDTAKTYRLAFGFILLLIALISSFTGKTYFRGTIIRCEKPNEYWFVVAAYYLGGIVFIASFIAT